jgi:DNA primase
VRRAALAVAREVERRSAGAATSKWWKEERPPHAVFIDYNQNAKDHTTCAAYSVRPVPDARVSTPLHWDEVGSVEAGDLRIDTVPGRLASAAGDPSETIDDTPGLLDGLLALADADEHDRGLSDAPWPPHHPKGEKEPPRVQPSRAKKTQ